MKQDATKSWKKSLMHAMLVASAVLIILWFSVQSTTAIDNRTQIYNFFIEKNLPVGANHPQLEQYYFSRNYQPRWIDTDSHWEQALAIIDHLAQTNHEGLNPNDYQINQIQSMLNQALDQNVSSNNDESTILPTLDVLITSALMQYMDDLHHGRLNKSDYSKKWFEHNETLDYAKLIDHTFIDQDPTTLWQAIMPLYDQYQSLVEALKTYEAIKYLGGWTRISDQKPTLKLGISDSRVTLLKIHLFLTNDLETLDEGDSIIFDETLEAAVKSFQKRHGLDIDGEVGEKTLKEMNIPVERRIDQIKANLERWRWLPRDLGKRYVIVNAAGFYLNYFENNIDKLSMKVIVGRTSRKTPIFHDEIEFLVLNPNWYVPRNIAVNDLLPKIKKNANYIKTHGYRISRDGQAIDPGSIKWTNYSGKNFPYKLTQRPGRGNALGQIKFKFPNKYNVYLHDTPDKHLFDKSKRLFSSGCIRIEKPLQLAEKILADEQWSISSIAEQVASGKQRVLNLAEPVPIYILYWTTWVENGHNVHFSNDDYNRDDLLIKSLNK